MLRITAIGLVSAIALGIASPAGAMGGKTGGGAGSAASTGGGAIHSANAGPGSMMGARSYSSPGRIADHDMGRMWMGRDHDRDHDHDRGRDRDHDRDRHDHDSFRFFPAFAFGVNTYADVYDPTYGDCWQLHRVWRHGSWRLHRFWVCT
jgi:hypothetical protein